LDARLRKAKISLPAGRHGFGAAAIGRNLISTPAQSSAAAIKDRNELLVFNVDSKKA